MKKLQYIEFLRVVATLGVLCNHVPLAADHIFKASATLFDDVLINSIVSIVHWAVPVFVMITGALLLDPAREITFGKAIKKYFGRIAVIVLTVGWAFALMEEYTRTHAVTINLFTTSFYNVLVGKSWKHLWYLYMLMGLYLVIPFIKPAINDLSHKSIDCMLVILFFFTSVLPTISHYCHFNLGIPFPTSSVYLLYLILGWRLTQLPVDSWLIRYAKLHVACAVVLSLFLICCCYWVYANGWNSLKFLSGYTSPIEVVMGALLFVIALAYKDKFDKFLQLKSVQLVNRNSFGIYVFHMLWVNIIYKVIKFNPLEYSSVIYLLLVFVVLILSILTTEIFRKIPWLGKFI